MDLLAFRAGGINGLFHDYSFPHCTGKRIHFIHQAIGLMQCIDSLTVDAEKFAPLAQRCTIMPGTFQH
jgi:hypothetical protein